MSTELDAIKRKIMSLAAKTVASGCSEHEALSAMAGVGRLLAQYNLTMEECDVRSSPCKTLEIDVGRKHRHPLDGCVCALADLVNAKIWFQRYTRINGKWVRRGTYAFFGQTQDLEVIEYLFNLMRVAIENGTDAFKQSHHYGYGEIVPQELMHAVAGKRRSATCSFQRGMARTFSDTLRVMKQENDAELAKYRTTGTALMVLKDQLIEDEWRKLGLRLGRVGYNYRINDGAAYQLGKAAGERVNLRRRPIKDGNEPPSGLLT